ncbi:hypothetical protein [Novosphingobium sp. Gsoil 351]|uniref:hypothetical protein n=1 Tax=Novosphingobium sp. Gsoil 351 TaxID=2675225 RepID=UPI0012B4B767|nr:hypothetical protein [Novosphingobium sp. Gsoil 351]QGN53185.1 hypothetical protein GKE62_00015 [Novosphingobium sp. Gsoil 351]
MPPLWPREQYELVTVIASGDRVQDRPRRRSAAALWTKELDARAADERRIDAPCIR